MTSQTTLAHSAHRTRLQAEPTGDPVTEVHSTADSDAEPAAGRRQPTRAILIGAGLGAWLGLLGGTVLALLPYTVGPAMLLGGLLIGAAAGGVIGLIIHRATGSRRHRSTRPAGAPPERATSAPRRRLAKSEPAGGMRVTRTALPGVGISYIVTTADGQRIGVVAYANGRRELTTYDANDPDRVMHFTSLTEAEARTVAQILGMPVIVDQVPDLARGIDGVQAVRIPIAAGSPFAGRRLADTRARTRTGASVVAVVRDGAVKPSPSPSFAFRAGDSVVAVGDDAATTALRDVLIHG